MAKLGIKRTSKHPLKYDHHTQVFETTENPSMSNCVPVTFWGVIAFFFTTDDLFLQWTSTKKINNLVLYLLLQSQTIGSYWNWIVVKQQKVN